MITETTEIGAAVYMLAAAGMQIRHVRCVGGIWHATLVVDDAHVLGDKNESAGMGPTMASAIEDARDGYVRYCAAYLRRAE